MGWKFTQIQGPQKVLFLDDWSAPFGRPRKEPVVRDAVELREAEVYYPGNSEPTHHLFGTKYSPWEIHGYFRDRAIGTIDGALAMTAQVKQFVADQQQVRVTWDDIVSIVGLITKFDPGRESRAEVEWKMTIKVDSDDFATKQVSPAGSTVAGGSAYTDQIISAIQDIIAAGLPDGLTQLVNTISGIAGDITDTLFGIEHFADAPLGQLNRLETIGASLSNSAQQLDSMFSDRSPEDPLPLTLPGASTVSPAYRTADSDLALAKQQSAVETAVRAILVALAKVNVQIQIAKIGQVRTTHASTDGETWESIALAHYGDASRATDLQAANASTARAPRPGTQVQVPI